MLTAEEILSLVCVGGEPIIGANGKYQLIVTTEFYLKSRGFAESQEEAELIVALVATFLMALLHKSTDGQGSPFPGRTYGLASVTGMPSAVKPFRTATRTWNSAT